MSETVITTTNERKSVSSTIANHVVPSLNIVIHTINSKSLHVADIAVGKSQFPLGRLAQFEYIFSLYADVSVFNNSVVDLVVNASLVYPNSIPLSRNFAVCRFFSSSLENDRILQGSVYDERSIFVNPQSGIVVKIYLGSRFDGEGLC